MLLHFYCDITGCDSLLVCLCPACSAVFTIRTAATHTSALDHVTMMSSSGEGLQSAVGEDLESDDDQDPSGMFNDPSLFKGILSNFFCSKNL